jgi:hypothetical protein
MVEKRRRNNSGNGRRSVTFGPSTVRNFFHDSRARNGVNSVLPAPGLVAKQKPGNFNSLPNTTRLNGQHQTVPIVPLIPKYNTRRNPLAEKDHVAAPVAAPLGPAVVGLSPSSLWPTLSKPKGGRRVTRKRLTRKRS